MKGFIYEVTDLTKNEEQRERERKKREGLKVKQKDRGS